MEENDIKNIFNELKKSPLYNLSMSSLENFHTNFLVWLGNKHPEQTWTLLTGEQETPPNIKFEAQKNCGKNCKFDLCVKEKDNIILVLENKIKSYPTEEQLEKYNNGIKNNQKNFSKDCKKILLTLFPFEIKNREQCKGWRVITYSKLAEDWKNFFNLSDVIYPEALVIDYFNMIEKIDEIVKIVKKEPLEEYNIYEIADKLEDFHDVYVKYRTFNLMNFIKQDVENNKISTENIKFSTDFSNSNEGVINIEKKYIIEETKTNNKKDNYDFILSIQIQGSQYRYCLVCLDDKQENNKKRFDFAESLKEKKYWFNDTENKYNSRKNNPYHFFKRNQYLSYKPDRIYQYKKIESFESNPNNLADVTYESISEQVSKDIQTLNNKEEEIIACYKQILSQKNS